MPRLQLKDFFDLLCSLKNATGWIQEPGGRELIKFLATKAQTSSMAVKRALNELEELKYIKKDFRGSRKKILWRVKILIDYWNETPLNEKHEKEMLILEKDPLDIENVGDALKTNLNQQPGEANAESQVHLEAPTTPELLEKEPERRFAIFMDFVNLEKGLPKYANRFRDFSWLLDPILKKGKIIFAFVFIPEHYVSRAPIMQLTHKHHFHSILCPRQIGKSTTKDADTVDAQLQELAWPIIQIPGNYITDVVIVSGDADFQGLATRARWQQKEVTVISTAKALSGRFLEMEEDKTIVVQLV